MVIQKMSELGMEESSMIVHDLESSTGTGTDLSAIQEATAMNFQQQQQQPLYANTSSSFKGGDDNANSNSTDNENNSIPVRLLEKKRLFSRCFVIVLFYFNDLRDRKRVREVFKRISDDTSRYCSSFFQRYRRYK